MCPIVSAAGNETNAKCTRNVREAMVRRSYARAPTVRQKPWLIAITRTFCGVPQMRKTAFVSTVVMVLAAAGSAMAQDAAAQPAPATAQAEPAAAEAPPAPPADAPAA